MANFKKLLETIEMKFVEALYENHINASPIIAIYQKVRNQECKLAWEKEVD